MAKNIDFMGATFPDVPSIRLPQHEGGLVSFTDVTDTTAIASDVANGKYFYTADGTKTVGTASGGITPSGTISITQNGTVDVTQYASADVNVSGGGGGASNFVTGTFITGSSDGVSSLTIPYTGNGYPIMAVVVVEGGAFNSGVSGWYYSVQKQAVGQWTMTKAEMTSSPTYATSTKENRGVTTTIYKSSASSNTSYSRTSAMNTNTFSSSDADASAFTCVRLKSGNVLSYYVSTSVYGLLPNTEYRYFIVYSSQA